jgi:RNA polymerase sigma-70 factor (ECF subfamily)
MCSSSLAGLAMPKSDPLETAAPFDEGRHDRKLAELVGHRGYLEVIARRLCRDRLDPDDLVQDLFEKCLRSPQPIPDGVNPRAWLARVLHNLFIDKLRRARATGAPPLVPANDDQVDDAWWVSITEAELRAAVRCLPEEQRGTFELFAFEGRSYDEIAHALGIAKSTVGTRILRARQRLRELLTRAHRGD